MAHRLTKITIIVLLICISAVLATAFSLDGVVCAADGKIGVVVTASFENDAKVWNASVDDTCVWTAHGEFSPGKRSITPSSNLYPPYFFKEVLYLPTTRTLLIGMPRAGMSTDISISLSYSRQWATYPPIRRA